jgi:hypothetical protein
MTRKFFCYVDESGQDTQGKLFIVSVVIAEQELDQLRAICTKIEQTSGKGERKWIKTSISRRRAYIEGLDREPIFNGKLNFAVYRNTRDCRVDRSHNCVRAKRNCAGGLQGNRFCGWA